MLASLHISSRKWGTYIYKNRIADYRKKLQNVSFASIFLGFNLFRKLTPVIRDAHDFHVNLKHLATSSINQP